MFRGEKRLAISAGVGLLALWLSFCLQPSAAAAGLRPTDAQQQQTPVIGQGAGPTTSEALAPTAAEPRLAVDVDYRLSAGDVVHVSVYGEPTLSGAFRIGPGGSIAMPILGQTGLRGLSLREAQALLTQRVGTVVKRPGVTVALDEIASVRKVYVSGETTRMGALSLPFGATLTDALAAAGPGPYADLRRVRLTHPGGKPLEVDCSGLRTEGPLGADHHLEYGDSIYVPPVREEITVLGEVLSPGKMPLPVGQEITVLDALRMSQGFTPTADRSRAVLLRDGAEPITISLDGLLRQGDVSQNRLLQGGDVLVVHQAGSISVVGQVVNARVIQSGAPVPILQALAAAGGPSATGDLARAEVIRDGKSIPVDLQTFVDQGQAPVQFDLEPGDVLLIPKGAGQNVLVMGALGRTGVVNLRGVDQRDLLRMVTISGPGVGSDLRRVTVYRDNKPIVRDIKALMEEGDMSQNLDLEAGDLVMVPPISVDSILVTGAAARRGVMQLAREEEHDLLRIVTLAGPGATADLSRVKIHRGEETIVRNIKAAIDLGRLDESIMLQDGDVVVIPEVEQSVVLTGALQKTGLVRLYDEEWRDLAQLVMMSGPLPSADLSKVTISRGDEKIVMNIRAFIDEHDRTQTTQVQDGDMIRVPAMQAAVLLTGALTRGGVLKLYDGLDRDLVSLVMAGGPTAMADLEHVTVHRGDEKIVRNLRAMIEDGDRSQTLPIEPGDVITVPMRQVHNVLVTGAVGRPGLVQIVDEKRRDLAGLVTLSAPLANADLTKVKIHRGDMTTERDVKAYIDTGLSVNTLLLEDGDVVVVPRGETSVLMAGAVSRTGTLQLINDQQRDLASLVIASSPAAFANLRKVRVHRGEETIVRDIYAYVHEGDRTQTLQVQDGDIVLVPVDRETVLITGAVQRAGTLPVSDPERRDLVEVLTNAGPLPTADLSRIAIYRGTEERVYDLSALREEGTLPEQVTLQPGDRVLVPGLDTTTVLIAGAIARQGTMELTTREQRDLAKVIVSSGPSPTADLSRVTVYRGGEAIVRDVRAYLEQGDEEQTVLLADGDRVLVPDRSLGGITITGEVLRAGPVASAIGRQQDLLGAVMQAGPSRQTADLSQVVVFRKGEKLVRDLVQLQEAGDLSQNLTLEPGDMIHVPQATATVVFTGEVMRAGPLSIHTLKQRDLARLLPLAGPKAAAGLDRVTIYRDGEAIVRDYLALSREGDLSQNIELEPGDFVYVPLDDTHDVMVLGALARNGSVNVREPANRDLLRIVTVMGPQPTADLTRVTVYRADHEPIYRDLKLLRDEGDLSQTMDVEPGDVVVVPNLNAIYVLGGVARPGAYPLDPDWGLMDVLSRAGLGARTQRRAVLIRYRPDGTTEDVTIDLRGLARGRAPEPVKLRPGDILYVPPLVTRKKKSIWSLLRDALWIAGAVVNLSD